jgi:hypothetical protein
MKTTAFDDAFGRFKTAEGKVAALAARHAGATSKLLQARMDAAEVERRLESFASNPEQSVDPGDLVAQQLKLDALVNLLERAIGHVETELARAKAETVMAEAACVSAQKDYHRVQLDQLCDEFLRTNTAALQKLTDAAYRASLFFQADGADYNAARFRAVRDVTAVFEDILPEYLQRMHPPGSNLREACAPAAKGKPIAEIVQSSLITAAERADASMALVHGIDRATRVLIPQQPDEPVLDTAFAYQSARDAAASAEHHRQRAAHYRSRLAQRPGDESIQASITQHEREAERYDGIVRGWDEQLQAAA